MLLSWSFRRELGWLAVGGEVQVLIDESWRGRRWVVKTDIADCGHRHPQGGVISSLLANVYLHQVGCWG